MSPYPQEESTQINIDGYRRPEEKELLHSFSELIETVRARIQKNPENTLVAIDGIPGSQKQDCADFLAAGLKNEYPAIIRHSLDKHIKTTPGSTLRRFLHFSDSVFEEQYMDDRAATLFINKMSIKPAGSMVGLGREYSHKNQSLISNPSPIVIPEGEPRVIIVDGTGAIDRIAYSTSINKVVPIMLHREPEQALEHSIKEDERRHIQKRETWHIEDIKKATRLRVVPALSRSDLIYFDNTRDLIANL